MKVLVNPNEMPRRSQAAREGIIIEGMGDSYAEVFKSLRDAQECGARVRKIEQTASRGARISVVEVTKGGCEKFKQKITQSVPATCTVRGSNLGQPKPSSFEMLVWMYPNP